MKRKHSRTCSRNTKRSVPPRPANAALHIQGIKCSRKRVARTRFDVQARFDVRDRTAVITGGSGYFGRAMASALAQAGAQVAILARHAETMKTVAESIQAEGGWALGIACDVQSRAALEQSREQVTTAPESE